MVIPNASARRATARPIAPRPTTPSVFPASPRPSRKNMLHDHLWPARTSRSPSPRRRVTIRMRAVARSAVASVSTPGGFVTPPPARGGGLDIDVFESRRHVGHHPQPGSGGVEEGAVDAVVQ